jgi:polysaccharide biosynthesis protein PelG
MAGIGFSFRSVGSSGGYFGLVRSLGGAGVVSCGPWLIASAGLLAVSRCAGSSASRSLAPAQFQTSVTWILACSLICTAPVALTFTRFVADRTFTGEREQILPNLLGVLACVTVGSTLLALSASAAFGSVPPRTLLLLGADFVCASDAWIVVVLLASLRQHRAVLGCFALGYGITSTIALCCMRGLALSAPIALDALLAAFGLGQACLLFLGLGVIARSLPRSAEAGVALDCFRRNGSFIELGLAGLAFNLGCWADELVCWIDPATSRAVLGPLRASPVYDLPSFAASACLIPGTAVFIVHVETEFAERHRAFFEAVLGGATLTHLQQRAALLTRAARRGIASLIRTQAAVWLTCLCFGSTALHVLSGEDAASIELSVPLFELAALGAALQMLVSAVLSMLFYLDRRRAALLLSLLVCGANAGLCTAARRFGVAAFGCGHVVAMTVACLAGLALLDRALANLVRDTFLMQPAAAAAD